MKPLSIEPTDRTPTVLFDFDSGHLEISGESYPEDATEFYTPVFTALDSYLEGLGHGRCRFDLKMVYFNSSSAKAVMMLLDKLDAAAGEGAHVSIRWFYDEEDETMKELGEEFSEDLENTEFSLEAMTR
jgi:SiaC family regulatory phosphoprotein